MAVRDRHGTRGDTSEAAGARLVVALDGAPPGRSRLAWRVGLVVVLLAGVVGAGSWWLAGGTGQVQARPAAAAPPAPAPVGVPAGLVVHVRGPASVVAGSPARFVVSYTDGEGIFSGGDEDWGDTGVGSVSLAACPASPPAAASLHASYAATHTWTKAASYPVSFAVTTYTCRGGRAMEETRHVGLTVVVSAR